MARIKKIDAGDVFQIYLGDDGYSFARVLESPLMAFYDLLTLTPPSVEEIINSKIIFKVWVMKSAFKSRHWKKVGYSPLTEELTSSPTFFKVDPISKKLSIYRNGVELSATYQQCKGLERAAVWEPEHIEDRLRDHFRGIPNKWVELLKLPAP